MKILYQAIFFTPSPKEPSSAFSSTNKSFVERFIRDEVHARYYDPKIQAYFLKPNYKIGSDPRYVIVQDYLLESPDDYELRKAIVLLFRYKDKTPPFYDNPFGEQYQLWMQRAYQFCSENKLI